MYEVIRKVIVVIVCKILFRVKYENLEILNKYEKCILCPNHSRIFDPVFLYPKVNNMYSMAKSELFKHKFFAKLLTYHNVFPVQRDKIDINAVRKTIKLLNDNEKIKLLIFPEGKVLKDKTERGQVRNGAIHIAAKVDIPIIPVYITARPPYFSKVIVKFGEPILPNKECLKDKDILKSEAKSLISAIYNME